MAMCHGIEVARKTCSQCDPAASTSTEIEDFQMNNAKSLSSWVVAAAVAVVVLPAPASAKVYSCKNDKALDSPMRIAVEQQSVDRLHLSAFGGSDRSAVVTPVRWTLYDASGKTLSSFPQGLLVWVSANMLKEANLEGLALGAAYTVGLTSADFCNNQVTVKQTITVNPQTALVQGPEANAPSLSAPRTIQTGSVGSFTNITFSVTDDSGINELEVFINGAKTHDFQYHDGMAYRWWFDNYPDDNTISTLEGPNYYLPYPATYQGQLAFVEVVATDIYGNRTTTSSWLPL
jgi:hypothetical protein